MIQNFRKKIKTHFEEIIKLKTSPHSIALGFAIGTFISVLPTPFINLWIGAMIVLLFKKINKFSLFFALLFWNPITMVPIYAIVYWFGDIMFVSEKVIKYNVVILDNIYNFTTRYLLANFIVAVLFSIISYFFLLFIITLIKKCRK